MSDPRECVSPFGVLDFLSWDHPWNQHHYAGDNLDRALRLMHQAGVGTVRTDFIWSDLEPEEGRWLWDKYDHLVGRVRAHGLALLGVLAYNAAWSGKAWNQAPDAAAYARFARAVIARYKTQIRDWQVWNEPDHADYWTPQDDLQTYLGLLQAAYPQMKTEDPSCRVHLGGLSRALPRSLKNIYEQGGRAFFDVADVHVFINPVMPDALGGAQYLFQSIRKTMAIYGDQNKPVWFTEFGCPGVPDGQAVPEWWLGKNPTEKVQAGWVTSAFTRVIQWPGVAKIFWAFFRDTPNHFGNGTDYLGLVRHDFSPKPSYEAYRRAAEAFVPAR